MDMFEVQRIIFGAQDNNTISTADANALHSYIKMQDELIESLKQENLILRKELDPSVGERMITKTG